MKDFVKDAAKLTIKWSLLIGIVISVVTTIGHGRAPSWGEAFRSWLEGTAVYVGFMTILMLWKLLLQLLQKLGICYTPPKRQ